MIQATTVPEFERCLENGVVLVARVGGNPAPVGVIAAASGAGEVCFSGHLVYEELLDASVRGRGLGAALQRHLIESLTTRGEGDLLAGTILGENIPSIRTAMRCGRVPVACYWWVGLDT